MMAMTRYHQPTWPRLPFHCERWQQDERLEVKVREKFFLKTCSQDAFELDKTGIQKCQFHIIYQQPLTIVVITLYNV